jgi:hypothetical protein
LQRRPGLPATTEADGSLRIPFNDGYFVFEPPPDDWILPLLQKVCQLGSLPPNWNSYGAKPIQRGIAAAAVTMLLNLLSPQDPVPAVVPTSHGGILLEWHMGGIDLEVDIRSPSTLHVALEEGNHRVETDRADFEAVKHNLNRLRSRIE